MTTEDNSTEFDLENDAVTLLEQKKQEIIATSGGVYAVKEAVSLHTKHVEKVKVELQEMVSAGKVSAEVANFTLSYVGKSSKVLTDCLDSFKSRYDIKSGEALAYDNLLRKVKEKKSPVQKSPPDLTKVESQSQPPKDPPKADPVVSTPPAKRGRGKKEKVEAVPVAAPPSSKIRPDKRGKVGETVARLKAAREMSKKELNKLA